MTARKEIEHSINVTGSDPLVTLAVAQALDALLARKVLSKVHVGDPVGG